MSAGYPQVRPRRLRRTPAVRALVAETSLRPAELVLPVFIKEGIGEPQPVGSMPGVVQHTRDSLRKAAAEAAAAGVGGLIVFGVPSSKDGRGSGADDPAGISQLALADLRAEIGDACVIMADLCLCEYTDHGHCGVLTADGYVINDATVDRYAAIAVAQAEAGADMVAPSGMMDGQVAAIRAALDAAGHDGVGICAYSVKYASGFYGPFREAAEGAPAFGDRASHQQDPANAAEALREVALDVDEGADMVMVKPALPYLDVIRRVADAVTVPVAAYQVSGEFSMVEAAAANGWLDRDRVIMETLTAIRRAGAGVILTYWAAEVARRLGRLSRSLSRTGRGSCSTIGNRTRYGVFSRPAAKGRSGRGLMVDVMRRRGRGVRGRAAERHQPLGAAAAQYASMGWPVCLGAHGSAEPGRACSCDRVGCPAPGAHPVSPAWQMQATVDLSMIQTWWEARPEASVILVTGRVFDVLDVPVPAGASALEQMEAGGAAVGPVALLGQDRMLFFVMTRGSPADEDEWWSCGLDCEPESVTPGLRWHCRDSYVLAPPSRCTGGLAGRWLRPPQGHPLPDALRLLEYLVDACEAS